MAAEAAVSFAVETLGNLLIQKAVFLKGVRGQVQWLKDELKRMQCFLKDAAEKQADDERVRNWVSEIRELAQEAQDTVEIFILKVENAARSRAGLLGKCVSFPSHLRHLNRVGKEIKSIRERLEDTERSRQRYGIQDLGEGSSRRSENVERLRRLSHWQKDKHVVGLEEDVKLLLRSAILHERKGLSVAAILGMGGIGKSTLARKVYNHSAVADKFEHRAWAVVSSEFAPGDIIKQIMLQLQVSADKKLKVLETMKKLEESTKDKLIAHEMLKEMLHEELEGKSYLVVLDDLWEAKHWEALRSAFPDEKDKSNRVLFTSRNQIITKSEGYIHNVKFLDPNESWELLLKTVGKTDGKCSEELETIGREILKKCGGLPLAITVAGGMLVNHGESRSGWEKVLKEMKSHMDRSGNLDNVSAILEVSYRNLPPELKVCFLCLGFFKEDATIRAQKLVHIWAAEGFVTEGGGESMEEIGRGYLNELINRNLIQAMVMREDGAVKTCRVHDFVHELSIRKAKEEISFETLNEEVASQSLDKTRHCALYCSKSVMNPKNMRRLRSVFFYGVSNNHIESPSYWKSFELLRVLDMEGFFLGNLPEAIGDLVELRYLGLRDTQLKKLPSSLGRLKNLLVLDLATGDFDLELSDHILLKLISLRVLYLSRYHHLDVDESLNRPALKIKVPKNLQKLKYIWEESWLWLENVPQLTSIRKLGIKLNRSSSDIRNLCSSLALLENLVCLNLRWSFLQKLSSLEGLCNLRRVTKLKLYNELTGLPSPNDFPPNLSYLILQNTFLYEDPMPVLEKLPNLQYLKLNYAYFGEEMVISHDGFPRLEVLRLKDMGVLRKIQVEKGGMPELKLLEIHNCQKLETENISEQLRYTAALHRPPPDFRPPSAALGLLALPAQGLLLPRLPSLPPISLFPSTAQLKMFLPPTPQPLGRRTPPPPLRSPPPS